MGIRFIWGLLACRHLLTGCFGLYSVKAELHRTGIVMKKYELTPAHRAQLKPWADKWIANAMSTKAMDDEDRAACREAVLGMYAAAKLPPPKHIVFVPSPFVLAFAGGFASAIWHLSSGRAATWDATDAATLDATRDATRVSTDAATWDATDVATAAATRAATWDATRDATRAATEVAADVATAAATWGATDFATRVATEVSTDVATRAATRDATRDATRVSTDVATRAATRAATEAATRVATEAATMVATRAATGAATWAATRAATDVATKAATDAATRVATEAATEAATEPSTRAATWDATRAATGAATEFATGDATEAATWDATEAATWDATWGDLSNWYVVNGDMKRMAQQLGIGDFGLQCAAQAWRMWSGGNQYSGYDAYLSFFQDIAKLPIDYSAYQHWRTLAERSGPRIVHPDFCMISDRPEILTVDDRNRPHNETGPFCRWRDGSELYSFHGARVPAKWIVNRTTTDPAEVLSHENVETRAAGAALIGWPKMLSVLKERIIDDSGSDDIGQLIELTLPGLDEPGRFLKAKCPRNGLICEPVMRVSDIDNLPINTALAAQAWRIGFSQSEYQHPPRRT